jgi:signal transduction histidine kinase/CheY-like chemotaxis protein
VRSHSDFLVQRAHAFRDFEHRMLRKDGQWIWLSVNGVPVLDPQGRLMGFRGAALDITDRKQYEQDLVREKEAAQAASVAKSQFLATMSHEIRTPLNSVLGFADLLAKSPLDPTQRENLETIRTSATGLMALLNDILEFSRTEAGPVNKPQPTRIRDFLGQVASLHMPVARGKGIDLRLEVETAVPEWLQLDQACLRQIVINLVGNAVKFTDHGFVRVSVSDDPEVAGNGGFPLRIAVTDTGVGILQETRQHLFEPFSQGDSSPTRKFGGTGLGLAVCRKLAGLVGGGVRLQDSSPHGSTFVFTGRFDVAGPPESPAPAATGTSKAAATPLPLRVLVAEDNPASRKLMQIMLSKEGIAHETAVDGEEVLAKHTRQAFDLILMDIRMPVMDGISATRAIRGEEAAGRLPGRVAIVALTADAMDGNRESCLRVGMDDCLNKPVNRETLAAVLAKHRRS